MTEEPDKEAHAGATPFLDKKGLFLEHGLSSFSWSLTRKRLIESPRSFKQGGPSVHKTLLLIAETFSKPQYTCLDLARSVKRKLWFLFGKPENPYKYSSKNKFILINTHHISKIFKNRLCYVRAPEVYQN